MLLSREHREAQSGLRPTSTSQCTAEHINTMSTIDRTLTWVSLTSNEITQLDCGPKRLLLHWVVFAAAAADLQAGTQRHFTVAMQLQTLTAAHTICHTATQTVKHMFAALCSTMWLHTVCRQGLRRHAWGEKGQGKAPEMLILGLCKCCATYKELNQQPQHPVQILWHGCTQGDRCNNIRPPTRLMAVATQLT